MGFTLHTSLHYTPTARQHFLAVYCTQHPASRQSLNRPFATGNSVKSAAAEAYKKCNGDNFPTFPLAHSLHNPV